MERMKEIPCEARIDRVIGRHIDLVKERGKYLAGFIFLLYGISQDVCQSVNDILSFFCPRQIYFLGFTYFGVSNVLLTGFFLVKPGRLQLRLHKNNTGIKRTFDLSLLYEVTANGDGVFCCEYLFS